MNEATTLDLMLVTAVTIAVVHTAVGVDHTLPFIALGRAQRWRLPKLLAVTAACGVGHVLSSVVLGFIGIGVGAALSRIHFIEAQRGVLASWLLVAFGAFFVVRWMVRMARSRPHAHEHAHAHEDGLVHSHTHHHLAAEHRHLHPTPGMNPVTVWTLFIIFAFGPCEPLIPLLMAPAALQRWLWVGLIALVFGLVTIATMVAIVAVGHVGLSQLRLGALERHAELLAGLAIAGSGAAILALGL